MLFGTRNARLPAVAEGGTRLFLMIRKASFSDSPAGELGCLKSKELPVETRLHFDILPQPDDLTCGPTCLHAVYRYYGVELALQEVIEETSTLEHGGTLAVMLACRALARGFQATIYTYNLQIFDPTWFPTEADSLSEKLVAQGDCKESERIDTATPAYLEFLRLGGVLKMVDLTSSLIRKHLKRGVPILTGLSSTYLYQEARECGVPCEPNDVSGFPAGHFVVLCGYDSATRGVLVADPLMPNPMAPSQHYIINVDRVICAILLGIVTYDANLLIIEPTARRQRIGHGRSYRRQ